MLPTETNASGKVSQVALWLSFDYRTLLVLAVLATVCFCLLNAALPVMPIETADSDAYVEFSAMRPHGYSWFLAAYRSFVHEDFAYLPSAQLAVYIGSLFLLATAIGCRSGSFPAAAAVLILACLCTRTSVAEAMMSDTLYAAALICATALLVLHVARPNITFI